MSPNITDLRTAGSSKAESLHHKLSALRAFLLKKFLLKEFLLKEFLLKVFLLKEFLFNERFS